MFLNEAPSMHVIIGGSIIVATLIVHAWLTLRTGSE